MAKRLAFALWALLAWTAAARATEFVVPPLSGPVVDVPHVLNPNAYGRLDHALRQLWESGGSQIAVLIVPELDGETIEQASIKVADKWKLGTKKGDNGVLLMISVKEHDIRMEVGQGLEGSLTDAYSRRIIDDVMIPYFRRGDPNSGVLAGVAAIAQYTDPDRTLDLGVAPRAQRHSQENVNVPGWVIILIIIFIVFAQIFGRRMGFVRRGGYWGGGYGGGSWGGGGGFSGGGGGFSGGGASDKW